jgi:FKBP-type peptidyl-prolyl cis-trans isomerase FkpA/FKBP-type peptidyl-prolyl cis-trans isomerase FklB
MRLLMTLMVSLLLSAASAPPVRAADPGTEEQKTFYALGLIISQSLAPFALSESEMA